MDYLALTPVTDTTDCHTHKQTSRQDAVSEDRLNLKLQYWILEVYSTNKSVLYSHEAKLNKLCFALALIPNKKTVYEIIGIHLQTFCKTVLYRKQM